MSVTSAQVAYEAAARFATSQAVHDSYADAFKTWMDAAVANQVRTVTNKALTTNVATLTIGAHPFQVGDSVVVAGVDATFNGTVTLTAVTATTISYSVVHADVASVAATGTATGPSHVVAEQAYAAMRAAAYRPNAAYGTPDVITARAAADLAVIVVSYA